MARREGRYTARVTGPLLVVVSLALVGVVANFVAVLYALREARRGVRAVGEAAEAAERRAGEALAAHLAEVRAGQEIVRQSVAESNDLTRRSVEAVERALEFSRRAFEVAHQPSLHVMKVETVSGGSSVDTVLSVRVSLRNTGTSDAHDVAISGRFQVGPVNIDEVELPEEGAGPSQGFAGPDIVVHGTVQQSLTFELRDAIARSGRLFLVICVRCGDDFGAVHLAAFVRVWSGGQWVAVREKRKRVA